MRVSLEVFGIPEEALARMNRHVHDAFQRHLNPNGSPATRSRLSVRGGTCPLTGRGYLGIQIHALHAVELAALQRFADAVYAVHPLGNHALVRSNRSVLVEESSGESESMAPLDPRELRDGEPSCWVCGRFHGEEYDDPDTGRVASLSVRGHESGRVPLCTVCLKLLGMRERIE